MTDGEIARKRADARGSVEAAALDRRIARIEKMAWALDRSIRVPVIGKRIGLDGVLGLVPGVGDAAGALLSGWIILEAARAGAGRRTLTAMAANVAVDAVVGSVPVLGDLFDFAFKANVRNARLALDDLRGRRGPDDIPRQTDENHRAPRGDNEGRPR